MTRFLTAEMIPETIDPQLYLPSDRPDLLVPRATNDAEWITTPREVSYAFMEGSFYLAGTRDRIELLKLDGESSVSLFEPGLWGNHMGRAMLRVVLDPRRLAPIDMNMVYDNELASARHPVEGEASFYRNFVFDHGVLSRSSGSKS